MFVTFRWKFHSTLNQQIRVDSWSLYVVLNTLHIMSEPLQLKACSLRFMHSAMVFFCLWANGFRNRQAP